MLSVKDISRQYAGALRPAVSKVSLDLRQGEILVLVGESGSGKSTLLRLIAGLEAPDHGEVFIEGRRVADAFGHDWVPPEKREIGFVFQDGALFPHLTVAQNIGYGLAKSGKGSRVETVRSMLETVGLAGFEERYPHQLSGGESQRVAVARALAPQPKLILLDEPFSNLDPALRRSLRDEIKEILLKVEATAIMVTHDAEDALAVGDRIAVFREAKIEQVGTPSELYHHPKNAYCARIFGRANRVDFPGSDPEWVRPERMTLLSERGSAHDVEVQIVQLKNVGRHIEVTVECLDREFWTLFLGNGEELERGKKAWVRIESVSM